MWHERLCWPGDLGGEGCCPTTGSPARKTDHWNCLQLPFYSITGSIQTAGLPVFYWCDFAGDVCFQKKLYNEQDGFITALLVLCALPILVSQ